MSSVVTHESRPPLTAEEHNKFPNGRWSAAANHIHVAHPEPHKIVLMPGEAMELRFCEERIERGLEIFMEVGLALTLIRERRLYRATHDTFEAYCIERWDIKASRARQLCLAAEIMRNLGVKDDGSTGGLIYQPPTSERQVRPLAGFPPETQREIWQEAAETAPAGRVTTAHVEEVIRRRTGREPKLKAATAPEVLDAGTRDQQVRAAADRAIADVRELLDLQGTPDSEAASDVIVSLSKLEAFRDHLTRIEKLQSART